MPVEADHEKVLGSLRIRPRGTVTRPIPWPNLCATFVRVPLRGPDVE